MDVDVYRRPAGSPARRVGTLLVLPAGSGSNLLPLLGLVLPAEVLDRFDVVLFDPPGIRSTPRLWCGSSSWDALLGTPVTPMSSVYESIATGCAAEPIFDSIDSEQLAGHLSRLAAAVDDGPVSLLTLWGTSTAAARFAASHPEQVSGIVYDSPAWRRVPDAMERGAMLEQELAAFFDRCAARGAQCPLGPDPASTWDRLAARLLNDGRADGSGATLSVLQLQIAARMALMFPALFDGPVAQGIADAINGDPTTLLAIVDDFANRLPEEGISAYVWNWALRCHDAGPDPTLPGAWEVETVALLNASPRMGMLAADEDVWRCMLGFEPREIGLPEWSAQAEADPTPMLVLSSARDVATSTRAASVFTVLLPGAAQATRGGPGSTWSFNRTGCTDSVLVAFLVDHSVPIDPGRCAQA